jgi:uncharacterized RDD family membrane protein YckC
MQMEHDEKKGSVVGAYLEQNQDESQRSVDLGSTASPLAPLGRRALAYIIDNAILLFTGTLLWAFFLGRLRTANPGFSGGPFAGQLILQFIYAGYFYSSRSATPGKLILNLQVTKDSGEKLNFIEAGFRDSFGKFLSGVILGIGYLIAFFRSDRSALHDLVFKTKVILKN